MLGGRPSQGKSAIALQIAYDVAKQGFNVYFFSLEMSEEALIERLFCNLAMVENTSLLYHPEKYQKELNDFKEVVKDLKLVITYNIGIKIDDLYEAIEDLPQADMIVLDYIQAVRGIGDKLSVVNDYILRFRHLCKEKNMAGIMVSQINRGSEQTEGRIPQMWQLKGCIHGDSFVNGKKIKDIYEQQDFSKVKTYNTRNKQTQWIKPLRIVDTGKLPCYRIKTETGKEIILSEGTKLFNEDWISVKDLKVGDYIKTEPPTSNTGRTHFKKNGKPWNKGIKMPPSKIRDAYDKRQKGQPKPKPSNFSETMRKVNPPKGRKIRYSS